MSSGPVLSQQQFDLLVYCPMFKSWQFKGAMDENARPAKRPRLGDLTPPCVRISSPPVGDASLEHVFTAMVPEATPGSQYQHRPPTEPPIEVMKPTDIHSDHSGTDSRVGSSSTRSQDSAKCPRLAEIVCFGSVCNLLPISRGLYEVELTHSVDYNIRGRKD